jgi:hypothetical protein
MSNNINRIIELQQTDQNKVENGYYKPSLNYGNEITLEEGDELSLHSVFVDTVAIENSQIELDEDVNVSMKFYLYNRFNRTTDIVKVPSTDPIPQDKPDGSLLFFAQTSGVVLDRHIGVYLSVDPKYKSVYFGNFILNFEYQDSTGKTIKASVKTDTSFPKTKNAVARDKDSNAVIGGFGMGPSGNTRDATLAPDKANAEFYFFCTLGFPIIAKPNTLKMTSLLNFDGTPTSGKNPNGSPAQNNTGFLLPFNGNLSTPPQGEFDPFTFVAGGGEVIYEPVLKEKDFTISSGKYTASEIASVISDECQKVANQQIFTQLVESPFLLESGNQSTGTDIMVRATSSTDFEAYQTNSNQWIGASAISLLFNDQDNKFFWEFLHTPYYDTGGAIIVDFNASQDGSVDFYGSSNGGIVFNSLEPKEFWEDKLGFGTELLVHPQHTHATLDGQPTQLPIFNVAPNKQFTTAQVIADVGINKTGDFWKVPTVGTGAGQVSSATSNLTSIIPAETAIFETSADTGFYYLEINANYKNDFFTETQNFQTISGIISNYYNINSYTSADASAGIPYIHTGPPVNLSSFEVRILDQDKTLSDKLGENNTVFLQLTKANRNLPMAKNIENKSNQAK